MQTKAQPNKGGRHKERGSKSWNDARGLSEVVVVATSGGIRGALQDRPTKSLLNVNVNIVGVNIEIVERTIDTFVKRNRGVTLVNN